MGDAADHRGRDAEGSGPEVSLALCSACGTHNGKHTASCPDLLKALEARLKAAGGGEIAALRQKVELMRELGVMEADGIKLGPAPVPPKKEQTPEEWKLEQARLAQKQHDVMFAASGTKPKLRLT